MIQKLPTNSTATTIERIMLAELLPATTATTATSKTATNTTRTTFSPITIKARTTTTNSAAKTTATLHKITSVLVATATSIIKPLNLDASDVHASENIQFLNKNVTTSTLLATAIAKSTITETETETATATATKMTTEQYASTMLTGIVTGNVQEQLTSLFHKTLENATSTIKTFNALSSINNNTRNNSDSDSTNTNTSINSNNTNSNATLSTVGFIATKSPATTFIDFFTFLSSNSTGNNLNVSAPTLPSSLIAALPRVTAATTSTLAREIAKTTPVTISSFSDTLDDVVDPNTSYVSLASASVSATSLSATMTTTITSSVDYASLFGMEWPKAMIVVIFLLLILITIVGNTLVILAVLTTRRLRTVTNCFVMNLAITDWLVGTCVMPPAVILFIVGEWQYGWLLCDIWISLDVLLCTGSILSLCAISLDRYLAVTQPLTYSKKRRSKRLALFTIFIVWISALSITCPPILGWYEPDRRKTPSVCRYNQNKGYVVFSAMGSFFIPLAVMMYVYMKIGFVLKSRRRLIKRDANSERTIDHEIDCDNFLSESEHFQCAAPKFPSLKSRWTIYGSKRNSLKCEKCNTTHMDQIGLRHEASFYELVEISRLSSLIHCSAMSCKYGGPCMHSTPLGIALPNGEGNGVCIAVTNGNGVGSGVGVGGGVSGISKLPLHYGDSRASFSETCLTTTTTATALQNSKFNDDHQHQHHHNHNHHEHQHQQQQLQIQQQQQLQSQQYQHHQHQQQQQQQQQQKHHHNHRVPMRISTTKRDTKTAKTLTIVMGGFVACWLPFFVYYLLIPFLPKEIVTEHTSIQVLLTWVGWVNCAINPFIYAFYNPDFRLAFWRLTCRRICKQKPPPNHMALFRG